MDTYSRYLFCWAACLHYKTYAQPIKHQLSWICVFQCLFNQPWLCIVHHSQIQQTIFGPLGMDRSTFVDDVDFENDDVATPYVRESGQMLKASIDFVRYVYLFFCCCKYTHNYFDTIK